MGNCLVLENNKVIRIVRNDGKILEYTEPMRVHQILTQFSGHRLFDTVSNTQHLSPEAKLLRGRLYYLVPLPIETQNPKKKTTKKVRFASPEVEEGGGERVREDDDDDDDHKEEGKEEKNVKVVRVKIILSKQELQKLLEGGSVQEMVYQTLDKQDLLITNDLDDHCNSNKAWKPVLDSIPELE